MSAGFSRLIKLVSSSLCASYDHHCIASFQGHQVTNDENIVQLISTIQARRPITATTVSTIEKFGGGASESVRTARVLRSSRHSEVHLLPPS